VIAEASGGWLTRVESLRDPVVLLRCGGTPWMTDASGGAISGRLVVRFEDFGGEFAAAAHADFLDDRFEVVLDGVGGDE
jgi:hypothetical protein